MTDQVLAFAGAEGYGSYTSGGRGGIVVHVTSLADSGEGSLRWALEQVKGPRTVVFDVAGTITLKTQILVQDGNVTIAGQTAPGEGVTLEGSRIRIKADEVIMRGLHIRPGDGAVGTDPGDRDGLMVGTTDFVVNNVVIDHNSFSWAIDENVSINGKVQDLTFSNNIVAEGLSHSTHPKGEHSKGLLVSNWDGADGDDARISIVKNLFSDNEQRNPEVRAGQDIEIVNNYIYNAGVAHAVISLGGANGGATTVTASVIGNVVTPGASTHRVANPVAISSMEADSHIILSDNLYTQLATDANGNQDQSKLYWYAGYSAKNLATIVGAMTKTASGVTVLDSTKVAQYVLANVGAINGSGLDSVDTRIVKEVISKTGEIIDKVSEVGGASRAIVLGATDSDRDGMPDWFEDLYGLDKRHADHNGDNDKDGFTNLEEYINGLITGFDLGRSKLDGPRQQATATTAIKATALASATDVIGFLKGAGKIDLSAVVKNFDTPHTANEFIEIAYANGNSYISVDTDGVGGSSIKQLVAVVEGAKVTLDDITLNHAAMPIATTKGDDGDLAQAEQPVYDPHIYLAGTAGNDTFTIREAMNRIVETVNGGTDLAVSYIDYTLDANVENLSLKAGTVGIGNALDNKIAGNNDANRLEGLDGADRLSGMDGADLLLGGAGDDWVEGGAGNDVIYGGTGIDTLVGNAGSDRFCFDGADSRIGSATTLDRITDFSDADCIVVDGALVDFASLASATIKGAKISDALSAANLLAKQGHDMVVVNGTKDSWLFWDSDHNGSLDSGVTLSAIAIRPELWSSKFAGEISPLL